MLGLPQTNEENYLKRISLNVVQNRPIFIVFMRLISMRKKILTFAEIVDHCREKKSLGQKIVLTNGCFDILHRGHVEYLQASAKLGDLLVVALNSDESVTALKGKDRPIHRQDDRATVIAGLECVDTVFVFEGPRLDREIRLIMPDVYTKAGDYTIDSLDPSERIALETVRAEIRLLPFVQGYSTTGIAKALSQIPSEQSIEGIRFRNASSQLREVLVLCTRIEDQIDQAFELLKKCFEQGGKVLSCGNGGSAADAMHLCEELIGRYKRTRIPLPALCLNSDATALTCIANDFGFEQVFSRQVQGLGKPQDILVCFTTSGNSPNVLAAIDVARERGVQTILVSGNDGGKASGRCTVEIIVPSNETARIQEVHTLILHHWLERIDPIYANV